MVLYEFWILKELDRSMCARSPFIRSVVVEWWCQTPDEPWNALREVMHWVCNRVTVSDCDLCLEICYKIIMHMNELCFLGTCLPLWIVNNFLYLGYNNELFQEKPIAAQQTTSHNCMYLHRESWNSMISKLGVISVVFKLRLSKRHFMFLSLYNWFFVFSKINNNNYWLPE